MPLEDALVVSILMSCKGIVDLASFSFLKDAVLITDGSFSLLDVCLLVVASIAPALVKYLYDPSRKYAGYQERDIAHLKPQADLRILACVHIPENVISVLNFLSLCSPTKDTPISFHILHLIKLTGQASSVFISHQIQKKMENVIPESVVVNAYTSFTPLSSMHEDICTLALDKLTSLIILPFHQQWYINGAVESDDKSIEKFNCNMLKTPPCSIGILINHCNLGAPVSHESSHASYHVIIFLNGCADDREALSLAKCIVTDPRTFLTVVHLIAPEEKGIDKWEKMLNSEFLKEFKHGNIGNENVVYIEKTVKDGAETSSIMRSYGKQV